MELRIKPYNKNVYPRQGILVQGNNIESWLREIERMQLALPDISVYPLPDITPNSVWGCLIVPEQNQKIKDIGRNSYCQLVEGLLYIPEYTALYPIVLKEELDKLLKSTPHILHPKYGLFELEEKLDWKETLIQPSANDIEVIKPIEDTFIPRRINSFQIAPVSNKEMLKRFEEVDNESAQKEFDNKPLSWFEKAKLQLYKGVIGKMNSETMPAENAVKESWLMKQLARIAPQVSGQFAERMTKDYKNLQDRNQDMLDKLLELLANDPEEGLKYAIPLDDNGSSRGGEASSIDLSKRNIDLSSLSSLMSRSKLRGSGGGYSMESDAYYKLRQQYSESAKKLVDKGEYMKASYIYIKLLQDYHSAATTFVNAAMYQEAASVYLELLNNKIKAAECYETGKMYMQAIEVYKELEMFEKTGDIYTRLNKRIDANIYYQKVVDQYASNHQFVKASLIYKEKMQESSKGQDLLLKGWRNNADAYNCLNNYFANINDTETLGKEIDLIYRNEVNASNNSHFLNVIKHEYSRNESLAEPIKDIAYEIITNMLPQNPLITTELTIFNRGDKQIAKDTMKYKLRNKR